jgi:NADH-quinone oxidoreductase subunit N
LKYFILGAFSSALILFGMSLLFGLSGTTNLEAISAAVTSQAALNKPLLLLAMLMILAGLGFKVAAVPFHMWCPDAYEGAPTPVTAFISVAPKAAAFAIFIRLFMFLFQPLASEYTAFLGLLSILTMTLGNILAVKQTNIKRLLAYSSISHAGYLLMGLMVREYIGMQAIGVYLVCYLFMNIGAFTVVVVMRRRGIGGEELDDFSGLIYTNPFIAACMVIFLLSLAGIPPTAGFIAKYWVFGTVIKSYLATYDRLFLYVAVAGALNAVVALFYYFRIVKRIFMGDERPIPPLALGIGARLALGLTLGATLFIGLFPEPAIRMAAWIYMTFTGLQ